MSRENTTKKGGPVTPLQADRKTQGGTDMNELSTPSAQLPALPEDLAKFILVGRDLRKVKRKSDKRKPCECCGKHQVITELHHLVPLSMCAEFARYGSLQRINVPLIWLCPNCHRYLHVVFTALWKGKSYQMMGTDGRDIPDAAWNFSLDAWQRAIRTLDAAIHGGTPNE